MVGGFVSFVVVVVAKSQWIDFVRKLLESVGRDFRFLEKIHCILRNFLVKDVSRISMRQYLDIFFEFAHVRIPSILK